MSRCIRGRSDNTPSGRTWWSSFPAEAAGGGRQGPVGLLPRGPGTTPRRRFIRRIRGPRRQPATPRRCWLTRKGPEGPRGCAGSNKKYWDIPGNSPELVICFLPAESILAAALEADPALLDHALSRNVVLASPGTLLAVLKSVAFTWRQDVLTDSARELFELARQLYERMGTLGENVSKLGQLPEDLCGPLQLHGGHAGGTGAPDRAQAQHHGRCWPAAPMSVEVTPALWQPPNCWPSTPAGIRTRPASTTTAKTRSRQPDDAG